MRKEADMIPNELMKLLKKVEPHRNEDVLVDGMLIPKSAALLLSMLDAETEPDNRYDIYQHILLECSLADKTTAAVRFAWARYREFGDVTSLMGYSTALADNGEIAAGIERAREALDLAIRNQHLINYAAGNLVRQSLRTKSVEKINDALNSLVDSTQMPRKEDCALETDWTEQAEALGGDKELILWIRFVATRK
jgi:enolase